MTPDPVFPRVVRTTEAMFCLKERFPLNYWRFGGTTGAWVASRWSIERRMGGEWEEDGVPGMK